MSTKTLPRKKHKNKISTGSLVADAIIYSILALFTFIFAYPLYQVIICSISDPSIVAMKNGLMFWPEGVHFEAYKIVLQNKNLLTGLKNTLLYMTLGTTISFFLTCMTAYPLIIPDLWGKRAIMFYFTLTMYFGGGMIPYFILINKLGWMNTIWVMIIPGAVSGWNVIVRRTFYLSNIPNEIREAAQIDGAGHFRILFNIVIPLTMAINAMSIMFSCIGYWNMWLDPMIYMTDRSMYPLQSFLREILIDNSSMSLAGAAQSQSRLLTDNVHTKAAVNRLVKYANIVVSIVPILCVYPLAQKHFVKGAIVGSLKG